MRDPLKCSMIGLVAALAFSSVVALAQGAQTTNQTRNGGVPQNPQRKDDDSPGGPAPVRDLSGTYRGADEALLNNRIPPMTPAGQARLKRNIPDPFSASSNDPWKTCDPFGMPRTVNNQIGMVGFAQMPDRVIILEDFSKAWREIWTDGRQLPKNVGHKGGPSATYFGYSVGHWEGDHTLVVDTIGMDDSTWVDRRGYPHSVDAHVIERYERPDHNHLNVTETVDDPAYYTSSFVIAKTTYKWIPGQDDPTAAAIPFTPEHLCVASEAIDYMKLLAEPADEDAAIGNKKR